MLGILGLGSAALWNFLVAQKWQERANEFQAELNASEREANRRKSLLDQAGVDARKSKDQVAELRDAEMRAAKGQAVAELEAKRLDELRKQLADEQKRLLRELAKAEAAVRQAETVARIQIQKDLEALWRPKLDAAEKARLKAEIQHAEADKRSREQQSAAYVKGLTVEKLKRDLYFRTISLADLEFKSQQPGKAVDTLNSVAPEMRHWEWHVLSAPALPRELLSWKVKDLHPRPTSLSADGKWLAACEVNVLRVWEADTGKAVWEHTGHLCHAIAFHPLVAAYCAVGYGPAPNKPGVIVWDIVNKKEVLTLPEQKAVYRMAFSADGKRLAVADATTVKIWDLDSRKIAVSLKERPGMARGLAFSADGKILAASYDSTKEEPAPVKLWNASTGALLHHVKAPEVGHKLCLSPDGKRLASAGELIQLWELEPGKEPRPVHTLKAKGVIGGLVFNKDGTRLFTADHGGELCAWDPAAGALVFSVPKLVMLTSLNLSADESRLVLGGYSHIRVWSLAERKLSNVVAKHAHAVNCLAFSGNELLAAASGNTVYLSEVPSGKQKFALDGHGGTVSQIIFTRAGGLLAAASKTAKGEAEIKVWDTVSGKNLWTKVQHAYDESFFLDFTRDGKKLIAGVDRRGGGKAELWEAATGKDLVLKEDPDVRVNFTRFLGFHPFRPGFAYLPTDGDVLLPAPDGKSVVMQGSRDRIGQPVWSPSGGYFAMGSSKFLRVWNVATGQNIVTFAGPRFDRFTAAFMPDEKRLATISDSDGVMLWDVEARHNVVNLPHPGAKVESLAFSQSVRYLAAGGADGRVTLWGPIELKIAPPKKK